MDRPSLTTLAVALVSVVAQVASPASTIALAGVGMVLVGVSLIGRGGC